MPKDPPVKPFTAPSPQPKPTGSPSEPPPVVKTPVVQPVAAKAPEVIMPPAAAPAVAPVLPPAKPRPVVAKYDGLNPQLEERLYSAVGRSANDEEFGYPNGAASKVRVLRWYPKDVAEQNAIFAAVTAFGGVEASTE